MTLRLPSVAEISEEIDAPVAIFFLEDFPHFSNADTHRLSLEQISERKKSIIRRCINHFPALAHVTSLSKKLGNIETNRSASCNSISIGSGERVCIIFAYRPDSDHRQQTAYATSLPKFLITNSLSPIDAHFISIHHEIGHLRPLTIAAELSPWKEELEADTIALNKFKRAGGDEEVIKHYIYWRAMCAFLNQPEMYWVALSLYSRMFFDAQGGHTLNNYQSVIETRMRVKDSLMGAEKLSACPAEDIRNMALSLNQGSPYTGQFRGLMDAFDKIKYQNPVEVIRRNPQDKSLYRAVFGIIQNPYICEPTKNFARLVLEGAKFFTPGLVCERIFEADLSIVQTSSSTVLHPYPS